MGGQDDGPDAEAEVMAVTVLLELNESKDGEVKGESVRDLDALLAPVPPPEFGSAWLWLPMRSSRGDVAVERFSNHALRRLRR